MENQVCHCNAGEGPLSPAKITDSNAWEPISPHLFWQMGSGVSNSHATLVAPSSKEGDIGDVLLILCQIGLAYKYPDMTIMIHITYQSCERLD